MNSSVDIEERSPRPRSPSPLRHRRNTSATPSSPLRVSFDESDLDSLRRFRAANATRQVSTSRRIAEEEADQLRAEAEAAVREREEYEEENDRLRGQTAAAARANARLREQSDAAARAAARYQRDNQRLREQRDRERDVSSRERALDRVNYKVDRSSTSPATGAILTPHTPSTPSTPPCPLRREQRTLSPRIIQRGTLVTTRDNNSSNNQALMSGALVTGDSSTTSSSGRDPPPRMNPLSQHGANILNGARETAAERLRREEREEAMRELAREERNRRRRARISFTDDHDDDGRRRGDSRRY